MSASVTAPGDSSGTVLGIVLGGQDVCAVTVRDGGIVADQYFDRHAEPGAVLSALTGGPAGPPAGVTLNLGGLLSAELADGSLDHRVAVVRIAPRPATDPRLARNPRRRTERLVRARFSARGGADLLGRPLSSLDVTGVERIAEQIAAAGISSIAVVGTGSTAHPHYERQVADILQDRSGSTRISLASDLGGQGFIARESTAIHDCALADTVDEVLSSWESAVAQLFPHCPVSVARSDGGSSTVSWARNHPVIMLSSDLSLALLGAATSAGLASCRVHIDTAAGPMVGEVRDGLVTVGIDAWAALDGGMGWDLVIPQAELSTTFTRAAPMHDPERGSGYAEPTIRPTIPADLLTGLGSAVSRPSAWLDEVASITSAEQLDALREDVHARVLTLTTANGAVPGSARVVELSATAVPFSPAGTVRITARATGSPGPARPPGVGSASLQPVTRR